MIRVALVVVDDGLYAHRWVDGILQESRLEVTLAACISPWRAPGLNPRGAVGWWPTILSRVRYYGWRAVAKFALLWLGSIASRRSVAVSARAAGVPTVEVARADVNGSDFISRLRQSRPDVVVCAFSQRAGAAFLDVPRIGCLNVHFSMLPRHAGREPLFHAMLSGDGAGVTVHFMTPALDAGPVVAQEGVDLHGVRTLHQAILRACGTARALVPRAVVEAAQGNVDEGMETGPVTLNSWPAPEAVRAFRARGFEFV